MAIKAYKGTRSGHTYTPYICAACDAHVCEYTCQVGPRLRRATPSWPRACPPGALTSVYCTASQLWMDNCNAKSWRSTLQVRGGKDSVQWHVSKLALPFCARPAAVSNNSRAVETPSARNRAPPTCAPHVRLALWEHGWCTRPPPYLHHPTYTLRARPTPDLHTPDPGWEQHGAATRDNLCFMFFS